MNEQEIKNLIILLNEFLDKEFDLNDGQWRIEFTNSLISFGMMSQYVLSGNASFEMGNKCAKVGERLQHTTKKFIEGK